MKIGFFHDVKIIEDEYKRMYSTDFGYEVWERYLEHFSQVVVCTRKEDKKLDYKKYKLSSGDNVEFKLNEYYKSPHQFFLERKKISMPIKEIVREVDACIIRLPSIIGILAAKECIQQRKPWAVEVVGCCWDSYWNYGSISGKILAPLMYLQNKYYIRKSSHVIYVSKRFLQNRYPNKNYNVGISDVNIKNTSETVCVKRINKIKKRTENDVYTLGLVGSLNVNYKGHKSAIKVIKRLTQKGFNVKLKCLGGGDSTRWEKLCKNLGVNGKVEFCGTLPSGNQVLEWLDEIDLFIMPSLQEGLPRSMVEAMSRGCNVIGARTGGIPELIASEYIFSPKNISDIEQKVINFIQNKDESIRQSMSNFEKAKEFDNKVIMEGRKEFYKKYKEDSMQNII